jgi:hypothetical protein
MLKLSTITRRRRETGRRDRDFYPTPPHATRELLAHAPPPPDVADIVEPCCGDGAIVRVLSHTWWVWALDIRDCTVDAYDAGADGFLQADWLSIPPLLHVFPNLGVPFGIVTNPPFSCAREISEVCFKSGAKYIALLLRMNVEGSNPWREFWEAHPWTRRVPLWKRPSFTGDGKTDACNYAWFIWDR